MMDRATDNGQRPATDRPLSHGERVGVRGVGFSIAHNPSPCPSPEGERLSFAIKAHDGRGDRRQVIAPFKKSSPSTFLQGFNNKLTIEAEHG
jgi:hypothetical protein